MSRVGIFGGTFDPVHYGHLITASALCEIRKLDKMIFIPCFISPHKMQLHNAEGRHRIEMLTLALARDNRFEVSDYELQRGGISYTIDTVRHFKELYDDIDLIIGFDNLVVFDKWKSPDEILSMVNLVVLQRRIANYDEGDNGYYNRAVFVETPIVEISSTQVRSKISSGKSISFFLPEEVKKYIEENNLYRDGSY